MADHPCATCPRWWECNGVEWDTCCPWNPKNWPREDSAPPWPKINPYIDEKTESGLLEED